MHCNKVNPCNVYNKCNVIVFCNSLNYFFFEGQRKSAISDILCLCGMLYIYIYGYINLFLYMHTYSLYRPIGYLSRAISIANF